MNKNLSVSASIEINATPGQVWDAITNPEKMKIYLYGTETITDWKVGSPVIFQGEYQGQHYKDKGNVLQSKPGELLQYNYWSGFSGLEDKPENYSVVSCKIDKINEGKVLFTWLQEGFASEQGQQHTQNGLPGMLEQIRVIAETARNEAG